MPALSSVDLADVARALGELKLDGWLIYDFHGLNPVARRLLGHEGLATRRLFVWLPAAGRPVAVAHRIELQSLADFPGEVRPYAAWTELHASLGALVRGRRFAMEFSPEDAVPYLDRVPAGVLGLVQRLGGSVVSSAPLVTRFAARWSAAELADHRSAAEALAEIARTTLAEVVRRVGVREAEVRQGVLERMRRAGLETEDPPIVAFGANSANPHYDPPADGSAALEPDQVVLLDLWGRRSPRTVWADQTWMGFSGPVVPADVRNAWVAVRDARERAVAAARAAVQAGTVPAGRDLDRAAREHLESLGFGAAFVHRTGHSIDLELHGSGPHLDSYETDDDRLLVPGIGFSVEPGVYLPGLFGIRSEVNVVMLTDGPEVTPAAPQQQLIVA